MAIFIHYREILYIVDLLLWNTIVGKIYYRDSPSHNQWGYQCDVVRLPVRDTS